MKFKYYLRGAGIGIIASTGILSVAFLFQDKMSDAQIIQRAMELGMVMEEGAPKTLADISQGATKADLDTEENGGQSGNGQDDENAQGGQSGNGQDDENAQGGQSGNDQDDENHPGGQSDTDADDNETDASRPDQDNPKQTDKKKNDDASHPEDKPSDDDPDKEDGDPGQQDSGNVVTVTIVGGDVSRTVSAKVFEAGLVDSADEFNRFLGSNDYDNLLQPGTYEIEKGSSFEQIARILTER